jgi:hypothetical protein
VTAADCPYPADCPVSDPDPEVLRRVRSHTVEAGTVLFRGHKADHPADGFVPGVGNTRFGPLDGRGHSYASRRQTAALLESAFHDAVPPEPRVYQHRLATWSVAEVRPVVNLRLVDLRDPELERLGIARDALVTTSPAHYACTREWAATLAGRHVGGHTTHGLLWHSRQTELHARADHNPLTSDLLRSGETTEIVVVYAPPASMGTLEATGGGPGPLATGDGERLATAMANLIGAVLYPPGA